MFNLVVSTVFTSGLAQLIPCDLMMPHGDIDPDQHWLRYWLVVWWHQGITWTNVDLLSKVFCSIYKHFVPSDT